MVAFLVASLAVFMIVRSRLSNLFAVTAMLLMWSCGFLEYAVEARPYALVLAFLGLAVLCWIRIQPGRPFSGAHWGLAISIAGMLLSHCFAPFFVAPLFAGELQRGIRLKRFDRPTWAALLIPMLLVIAYIPLVTRAHSILFPPSFLPSWMRAAFFYISLLSSLGPLLVLPLVALFLLRTSSESRSTMAAHEKIFIVSMLLMPAVVMGYLFWAKVAFWPRYGIGIVMALSIGLPSYIARKTNRNIFAAGISVVLTLVGFCVRTYPELSSYWRPAVVASALYRQISPELPFVTASGLTFLEMDHREEAGFVKRLYYLTDQDSAVRYAHATIFETMPAVARYFPVRATIAPYHSFLAAHDRFLVFATPGYPEDWLLDKLKEDGLKIRQVCQTDTEYRDKVLYEVSVNRR